MFDKASLVGTTATFAALDLMSHKVGATPLPPIANFSVPGFTGRMSVMILSVQPGEAAVTLQVDHVRQADLKGIKIKAAVTKMDGSDGEAVIVIGENHNFAGFDPREDITLTIIE